MGHALVEESITVDNRTEVSFALHGALNGVGPGMEWKRPTLRFL